MRWPLLRCSHHRRGNLPETERRSLDLRPRPHRGSTYRRATSKDSGAEPRRLTGGCDRLRLAFRQNSNSNPEVVHYQNQFHEPSVHTPSVRLILCWRSPKTGMTATLTTWLFSSLGSRSVTWSVDRIRPSRCHRCGDGAGVVRPQSVPPICRRAHERTTGRYPSFRRPGRACATVGRGPRGGQEMTVA